MRSSRLFCIQKVLLPNSKGMTRTYFCPSCNGQPGRFFFFNFRWENTYMPKHGGLSGQITPMLQHYRCIEILMRKKKGADNGTKNAILIRFAATLLYLMVWTFIGHGTQKLHYKPIRWVTDAVLLCFQCISTGRCIFSFYWPKNAARFLTPQRKRNRPYIEFKGIFFIFLELLLR